MCYNFLNKEQKRKGGYMFKIINEHNYPIDEKLLQKASKTLCKIVGQKSKNFYAILTFVDKEKIQELNVEYRHKDRPTDVISFRMLENGLQNKICEKNYPYDYDREEKKVYIGELFICYDVAVEQSQEYGHSIEREICFLAVHGLLHLLGLDHEAEFECAIMFDLQDKTMEKMKLRR